jgi:hypothetical protein
MIAAPRLMLFLGMLMATGLGPIGASPCNTARSDASSANKAAENTAPSSEDAKRRMQSQPTAADQSARTTEPAPAEQPRKMRCGPTRR